MSESAAASVQIRSAQPDDVGDIISLIRQLAVYERLEHIMQVSEEMLTKELFGEGSLLRSVVAEVDGCVVGYAIGFFTFSTFLGKRGLWMEDLYVKPEMRGNGIGLALFSSFRNLAKETGCARFEWSVLDWNESAKGFYIQQGAAILDDWQVCRIVL